MTRIQLRRDTAENFRTINPTPAMGEPCFETDTNKLKIGDGTKSYNDLQYITGSAEIPQATTEVLGGIKLGSGLVYDETTGVTNVNLDELGNEVNALSNRVTTNETNISNNTTALGGTKLQRLTSEEYNALAAKDNTTLYVVNDGEPVPEYLDSDVSNLTTEGKQTITNLSFPSDRYTDLTLGASDTKYTVPADGYFTLNKNTNAAHQYILFIKLVGDTEEWIIKDYTAASSQGCSLSSLPMKKGDILQIKYTAGGQIIYFRFIYSEGAQ